VSHGCRRPGQRSRSTSPSRQKLRARPPAPFRAPRAGTRRAVRRSAACWFTKNRLRANSVFLEKAPATMPPRGSPARRITSSPTAERDRKPRPARLHQWTAQTPEARCSGTDDGRAHCRSRFSGLPLRLHDISTCFALLHRPSSAARLCSTLLRRSHSAAPALLHHLEVTSSHRSTWTSSPGRRRQALPTLKPQFVRGGGGVNSGTRRNSTSHATVEALTKALGDADASRRPLGIRS